MGYQLKKKRVDQTTFLTKQFQNVPLVTGLLHPLWIPDTVNLEGMFINPPLFHKTAEEYTNFILNRYTTDIGQLRCMWFDDPEKFEFQDSLLPSMQASGIISQSAGSANIILQPILHYTCSNLYHNT